MEIQNGGLWSLSYLWETVRNHEARGLGYKEHEESLPHHARSRNPKHATLSAGACYCDATSTDHYDNVVVYTGYALQ